MSNIDIIGEMGAFCDFGIFPDYLVVFGDGVDLVVVVSLEFSEAFIYVYSIGAQISTDEVHIGQVHAGGFIQSIRNLVILYLVDIDLFLIDF